MNRRKFIRNLSLLTLIPAYMKLSGFKSFTNEFNSTPKMPILFMGHGTPMNAIEDNEFVQGWKKMIKDIPTPNAVLCISAHWESKGTKVTAMDFPKTIHDFGGFPQALFDVQYPAPGSPDLAKETQNIVKSTDVVLDHDWGLDHGTWSVVKHLYPDANVPVIQMSLDSNMTPQQHYDLARELSVLRNKGVLIVGSGNIVHNLRMLNFSKGSETAYGYDWALEANDKMNNYILSGNHSPLINFKKQGNTFDLSIPTPEHFLPLLYILGLKENNETARLYNDKTVAGSISMTSLLIK